MGEHQPGATAPGGPGEVTRAPRISGAGFLPGGSPLWVAREELRKFLAHWKVMGTWDAFRHVMAGLLFLGRGDRFDSIYGTDTRGVLAMRHDEAPRPGQQVRSLPTHPRVARFILENLGIDHRSFTFIDFGCGKGRVLLCASEFPFRNIIGVEWSPDLSAVAEKNIRIFRSPRQRCKRLEVHRMDVLDFEFPEGDILLYMYSPFGPRLTRAVFGRVQRHASVSRGRFLVVFAGLGNLENALITGCYRDHGLEILRVFRTLSASSSWILGEFRRRPEAPVPAGANGHGA